MIRGKGAADGRPCEDRKRHGTAPVFFFYSENPVTVPINTGSPAAVSTII